MHDLSGFERRLAAGLNDYAGPARAVDAIAIARAARAHGASATSLIERAVTFVPVRRERWMLPATVRMAILLAIVVLATALLVFAAGGRLTPSPSPRAATDGAIAIERYAVAPAGWSTESVAPPREIVLVAPDGTVSAVTPPDREEGCAMFSPDGSRLALLSAPRRPSERTDPVYELAVADADAGAERNLLLAGFHPPQQVSPPSWAPDGSAIVAVLRAPDEPSPMHGDLLIVPVDGSPARTLVRSPRVPLGETARAGLSRLEGASWSPDGQWIAVRGELNDSDGLGYFVAVIRPDGTGLRLLDRWHRGRAGEWGGVVWAPDSRSVAYHRLVGMMDVYVASLEDGTVRALPASRDQFVAEWSPPGTHIATVGLSRDPVGVLDAATGAVTNTFDFEATAATWSAQGDALAIQDLQGRLWQVSTDDSRPPKLIATGAEPLCGGVGTGISWQELGR